MEKSYFLPRIVFLMVSFFREYGLSRLHEMQKSVFTLSFICTPS